MYTKSKVCHPPQAPAEGAASRLQVNFSISVTVVFADVMYELL